MRAFVLSALPLVTLAFPAPMSPAHSLIRRDDIVPFIVENGCDQYNKMLTAVGAARDLAKVALSEWWDQGKHTEVAATYLAIPDDGTYKDNQYAQLVQKNLNRVSILSAAVPFLSKFIDINCVDKYNQCSEVIEGKPVAGYAQNNANLAGHWYDVVLCAPWYLTDDPATVVNTWKGQPQENIAMDWLETDAGKMLHEMMHIDFITEDRGHINDVRNNGVRMYGSKAIADWVLNYKANPKDVTNNADSYTQFVNAIYMKNAFGFLPPPTRVVPLTSKLECFGEDDKYVDSTIDKNIQDFCSKLPYQPNGFGDFNIQYNEGLPEHAEFRFQWKTGTVMSAADVQKQCLDSLPQVIHGCDTTTHWKHGGAIVWGDEEYNYFVTPKHDRPWPEPAVNPAKCDVYYKFFYDEFYIYGGNFAGDDYGQNQLLPALRGCGVVSQWTFNYYDGPQSDGMEWNAYGQLPIGNQWDCVRKAVVASGGPADLGCGGS